MQRSHTLVLDTSVPWGLGWRAKWEDEERAEMKRKEKGAIVL